MRKFKKRKVGNSGEFHYGNDVRYFSRMLLFSIREPFTIRISNDFCK